MAVNRILWKPPFHSLFPWPCPACQKGNLAVELETLKHTETGPSRSAHDDPAWDPEWVEERFSALMICRNPVCGEIVAVVGRTEHTWEPDHEAQEEDWRRDFVPIFMSPAPCIFPLPDKCPEAVSDELKKAFSLFWSDTGSAANRLRAAAEALLTERGVARSTINRHGRMQAIALHDRIEKFRRRDPESADYLLAIKWLGNEGSHASLNALGGEDLLNGFELFEHVVERTYVRRDKHLKKIAKKISARKGRPIKSKSIFDAFARK